MGRPGGGRESATFVIEIRCRQGASWQGTIHWTDEKKSEHFRSALEMLRLMNDAFLPDGEAPLSPWEMGEDMLN